MRNFFGYTAQNIFAQFGILFFFVVFLICAFKYQNIDTTEVSQKNRSDKLKFWAQVMLANIIIYQLILVALNGRYMVARKVVPM
jgi:ABC-type iron transport system FetAB permease component